MPSRTPLIQPADEGVIRDGMVAYITKVIEVPDPFSTKHRFDVYGLDTTEITNICDQKEEQFAIHVNPNEVFDNPSVRALARHVAHPIGESRATA
jgi:acyl carrier protein